jgi:site-specific recombinase XerC
VTVKQQNKGRTCSRPARRPGRGDHRAVLFYAGARVQEWARLDIEDIAITGRTGEVRLHGTGDKVRTVPLPAPVRKRISA